MPVTLRRDGTFTIYQIEHYVPGYKWCYQIGMPENATGAKDKGALVIKGLRWLQDGSGKHAGTCSDAWREMGACGACWQRTGVMGAFSGDETIALMNALAISNPGHKFRVVCKVLSQKTDIVSTTAVPKGGMLHAH